MLRKLLKYDLRSGFGVFALLYAGLLAAYGLGLFFRQLKVPQLSGSMAAVLAVLGFAMIIVSMVVAIMRFHKGMFGAEGYLTQTLPVGKGRLIASKAITAYLMLLAGFVGFFLALLAVLHILQPEALDDLFHYLSDRMVLSILLYIVIAALVQLAAVIGEIYAAIALANTRPFQKNNILLSVIFFFAANFAVSMLELVGIFFIPLGLRFSGNGTHLVFETTFRSLLSLSPDAANSVGAIPNISFGLGTIIVDLAAAVGLLILTRWLMTKKTSVK